MSMPPLSGDQVAAYRNVWALGDRFANKYNALAKVAQVLHEADPTQDQVSFQDGDYSLTCNLATGRMDEVHLHPSPDVERMETVLVPNGRGGLVVDVAGTTARDHSLMDHYEVEPRPSNCFGPDRGGFELRSCGPSAEFDEHGGKVAQNCFAPFEGDPMLPLEWQFAKIPG